LNVDTSKLLDLYRPCSKNKKINYFNVLYSFFGALEAAVTHRPSLLRAPSA